MVTAVDSRIISLLHSVFFSPVTQSIFAATLHADNCWWCDSSKRQSREYLFKDCGAWEPSPLGRGGCSGRG